MSDPVIPWFERHLGPDAVPALPALRQKAAQVPHEVAIRLKRRGVWHTTTWERLAMLTQAALAGWAHAGLQPGQTLVVVGALGVEVIASLYAAQALGAQIEVAQSDVQADLIRRARYVLAGDAHDLAWVWRHRGQALTWLVVADEEALTGVLQLNDGHLVSLAQLLQLGLSSERSVADLAQAGSFAFRIWGTTLALAHQLHVALPHDLGARPDRRVVEQAVLADFALTWWPGVEWLLQHWLASQATLWIAEAQGHQDKDRREARADVWLTSSAAVRQWLAAVDERTPARGLARWAVRRVLSGRRDALTVLLRLKLRASLGIEGLGRVITDQGLPAPEQARLQTLGVSTSWRTPTEAPSAPQVAPLVLAGGLS